MRSRDRFDFRLRDGDDSRDSQNFLTRGQMSADFVSPLLTDAVEKVLGEPLERNYRIRTALRLNRNCVRGSYPE
jgi:hypothetical protein